MFFLWSAIGKCWGLIVDDFSRLQKEWLPVTEIHYSRILSPLDESVYFLFAVYITWISYSILRNVQENENICLQQTPSIAPSFRIFLPTIDGTR
jgi:hypothetical protein